MRSDHIWTMVEKIPGRVIGKEFLKSLKASFGTFIGFIMGVALKSVIILVMVGFYVFELFKKG